MTLWLTLIPQIPKSETVFKGHHDSVNAIKFNAELTFLLSGGMLFYLTIIFTTVTGILRQLWPHYCMGFGFTCPIPEDWRFLCWICHFNLLGHFTKELHSRRGWPSPSLCCWLWDRYHRHLQANLRECKGPPLLFCPIKFFWLRADLNSSKTSKPMMGQLRTLPLIGTFWGLLVRGLVTRKSGTCVCLPIYPPIYKLLTSW